MVVVVVVVVVAAAVVVVAAAAADPVPPLELARAVCEREESENYSSSHLDTEAREGVGDL